MRDQLFVGSDAKSHDCCETKRECGLEPPKPEITERCCPPDPCDRKCPPKTRARDAIKVDRLEYEHCFLFGKFGCGEKPLPIIRNWVKMEVRKRGFCKVLTCEPPTKVRADGALCFTWTDEFRDLPSGYYEGDIYIDGSNCVTVLLYLPPCTMRVKAHDSQVDDSVADCHQCGKCHTECRCHDDGCARRPTLDLEYVDIDAGGCLEDGKC